MPRITGIVPAIAEARIAVVTCFRTAAKNRTAIRESICRNEKRAAMSHPLVVFMSPPAKILRILHRAKIANCRLKSNANYNKLRPIHWQVLMRSQFETASGLSVPVVTASQMREIDRIAVDETGPNLYQMMENAGRTIAEFSMAWLGHGWQKAEIVILAGTGGNGGGGICAARHLRNRSARVRVLVSDTGRLKDVPQFQLRIYQATRGEILQPAVLKQLPADFIIDALIGYSLRAAPHGVALKCIRWANAVAAPVVALDVPSGLDATSGEAQGECIRPAATLTLALPKTGLRQETCGELYLADIGIPRETFRRAGIDYTSPYGERFWVKWHEKCAKN